MIYFISDTHFGHENIIEYENRPFESMPSMNRVLVSNWNECIGSGDLVFHLGDFSLYGPENSSKILSKLNGTKCLIRGNHDGTVTSMINKGFDVVLERAELKIRGVVVLLTHEPCYDYDGWNLHGHVHGKWKVNHDQKLINLGVENWKYSPVCEKELYHIICK